MSYWQVYVLRVDWYKSCEYCALGQAKKADVSKKAIAQSKIKGKRLYLDICLTESLHSKKHWLLVIGDWTDHAWGYFFKEKSELRDVMVALTKDLKATECIDIRYVCCNNAGENEVFERLCKQEELGEKFKYTIPKTPQQSGLIE